MTQVRNIICPDQNSGDRCQYSKGQTHYNSFPTHKWWKIFRINVRPHEEVGKYLEIFHPGVGKSYGLFTERRNMSLTYSYKDDLSSISVDIWNLREKGKSCVSFQRYQSAISVMSLCRGSLQIMMTSHQHISQNQSISAAPSPPFPPEITLLEFAFFFLWMPNSRGRGHLSCQMRGSSIGRMDRPILLIHTNRFKSIQTGLRESSWFGWGFKGE